MDYFEEELDLTNSKIKNIEINISELQDSILSLASELKQTQQFLIKLAHNQAEITKRVTMWPYIAVADEGGSSFKNDN